MDAKQLLRYLDEQRQWIQRLVEQLNEVQVEFNAQFDEFKARHDETLDHLTERVVSRLEAIHPRLRAAIEERVAVERQRIHERREKLHNEYLPARRQAADALLAQAQTQMSALREMNPQLDQEEEKLKREKAALEARLEELNQEIREKARGLGVVRHALAITKADRERNFVLGKLDSVNQALYRVRRKWEHQRKLVEDKQAALQKQWQMESIAAARLQAELDQLDDEQAREALALRRAARYVLDNLKEPMPGSDSDLNADLDEMIRLNVQTDDYHNGLAAVGGLVGLLRGVDSGLQAIRKSVHSLYREQKMHHAYLSPLHFTLPGSIQRLGEQWPALAEQFADEKSIGQHPTEFVTHIKPILEDLLAQERIEGMFAELSQMIRRATSRWQ